MSELHTRVDKGVNSGCRLSLVTEQVVLLLGS